MSYLVLVCGSTEWQNRRILNDRLDQLLKVYPDLEIVEGEARGADTFAREWAEDRNVPFRAFPADWKRYGKGAGPIRNQQMIDEGPDFVLAFRSQGKSTGTDDTISRAERNKISFEIVGEDSSKIFSEKYLTATS